jgi:glycosyltransferase involved in cell wall biosynthesis
MLYNSVLNGSHKFLKKAWLSFFLSSFHNSLSFSFLSNLECFEARSIVKSLSCDLVKPCFFDTPSFSRISAAIKLRSISQCRNFTVLARYSPEKRILELINLFNSLELGTLASLSVYGDQFGDYQYYLACLEAVKRNGSSTISLNGYVEGDTLKNVLAQTHCGLVLSQKENLSFSYIEFALNGCLVVSSGSVGASEYVKSPGAYTLHDPLNVTLVGDLFKHISMLSPSDYEQTALNLFDHATKVFCR